MLLQNVHNVMSGFAGKCKMRLKVATDFLGRPNEYWRNLGNVQRVLEAVPAMLKSSEDRAMTK
jgi:hypothetical protein